MSLPLETLREIIGYNPYHFWGLTNRKVPVTSACNTLLTEYSWQSANEAGRADLRRAIETAETRLQTYLGYAVAPHYVTETLDYARFYDQTFLATLPVDVRGHWKSVTLAENMVQAVGVEQLTLLETPTVVYSDENGDGLIDTFTLTFATTETDADLIGVYFAAADRWDGSDVSARWRILPVTVKINAGTCTITGRAWTAVKPVLYAGVRGNWALDPDDTSNFAATLEVYERETDPNGTTIETSQATFVWETLPIPYGWWCANSGNNATDPAALAYSVGRAGIRNARMGIVAPGEALYDSVTGEWRATVSPWSAAGVIRPPDRVTLRYLAGMPLEGASGSKQMSATMRPVVARLAVAELTERICACDTANREFARWQYDRARVGSQVEMYAVSREDLNNPFGTRAGQVYAWKEVKALRVVRGVAM